MLEMQQAIQDLAGTGHCDAALCADLTRVVCFPYENPEPVLSVDCDGHILFANPASEALLAVWSASVGEAVPACLVTDVRQVTTSGKPSRHEYVFGSRNYRFLLVPSQCSHYVSLYGHDTTQQKEVEQKLRENQQRLTAILAAVPECIKLVGEDGTLLEINPAGLAMLEADSPQQVLGTQIHLRVHSEERAAFRQIHQATFRGEEGRLEFRVVGLRGAQRWLETRTVPLRDEQGLVIAALGVTRDITERKAAEVKLRQERDFTQRILDTAPALIVTLDRQGRIQHCNRYFEQLSGYQLAELQGQDWFNVMLPVDDREQVRAIFASALGSVRTCGYRNVIVTRTGERRNVEWHDELLRDEQGQVQSLLAVGQDVTKRVEAELAAQEAEARYRKLIENSDEVISLYDREARIVYKSPAVVRMLGFTPTELIGQSALELCHPEDLARGLTLFQQVLTNPAEVYRIQVRSRCKDGSYRWLEITVKNELDTPGIRAIVCNYRDISQQRATQERLNLLAKAVDASINAIAIADLDRRLQYVNRSFLKMWGYEDEAAVLGRRPADFWQSQHLVQQALKQFLANGHWVGELTAIRADGSLFETQISTTLIRDADGSPSHLMGAFADITERRRAELALHELHVRYELVIQGSNEGIWDIDLRNGDVFLSDRLCEMTGYSPEFLQEGFETWLLQIHPDYRSDVERRVQDHFVNRTPYDVRFLQRTQAGEYRWYHARGQAAWDENGRPIRFAGSAADIHEQVLAEEALRSSQANLAEAQRIALIGSWEFEPHSSKLTWSDMTYQIFELDPLQVRLSYNLFLSMVHPDDVELVNTAYHLSVRQRTSYGITHRIVVPSGRIKYVHERCETQYDAAGTPVRSIGTVQDVTERVQAEQAIRSSEEKYRTLFEQMPDGVFVMDAETTMPLEFNATIARILGYSREEFAQLPISHHGPSHEQQLMPAMMNAFLREGTSRAFEGRAYTKSGELRYFSMMVAPLQRAGRRLFQCIARDITEERRKSDQMRSLQDQLAHITRLGTMGELAAGLAHELNQPLAAITMYAQLTEDLVTALGASKAKEHLELIRNQAMRAGEIIRRLRKFVKHRAIKHESCDVNHLIREVLALVDHDLRLASISVQLDLSGDLPSIEVDSIQIQQVILNLIRNAITALQDPGSLHKEIRIHTSRTTERLRVRIHDTGPGVSTELAATIFEPFTSTNAAGLGLGLAICRTIIEAHRGSLCLASPGFPGATFEFDLPIDSIAEPKHVGWNFPEKPGINT